MTAPSGSSSPAAAASAPGPYDDARLKSAMESGVKFQIKAGNSRWQCTLLNRTSHERQKATRTDSSSSISSMSSSSSVASK